MSGPSLESLQAKLQAHLLRGSDDVRAHLAPGARLGIYASAYVSRLTEALAHNFPALAKLLGPQDFATLARAYIAAHESRHFSVRWYGGALAEFLATETRYAQAPLLAELARWEWAVASAFDAADAEPIDGGELARIAPDEWARLRFTWHPSVQVLDHAWNAPQIWKALTQDAQRPAAEVAGAPQPWLVWRRHLDVRFRSLDAAEAAAIRASGSGATFGEICERAETAARAAAWLRDWIDARCLTAAALA
jgi:hypothetical protein